MTYFFLTLWKLIPYTFSFLSFFSIKTQRYQYAKDIPQEFINKEITLRGTITDIEKTGNILLQYQPIISLRQKNGNF